VATDSPAGQHLVVIGASAGGVQALRELVSELPEDFPAAILVVLHIAPAGTSVLPQILQRVGRLPASSAVDGEAIVGGHIYTAPPDCHLTVDDGRLAVGRGPRVNGHRPAIDSLFRSAAATCGPAVTGVILSGVLDDGTAGLAAIKAHGGHTLVQDPHDAIYTGMPTHAIEGVEPDEILSARELARALVRLAGLRPPEPPPARGPLTPGAEAFVEVDRGATDEPQAGSPSGLSCPECGGAIWENFENGTAVYRCRTGHAFSPDSLLALQTDEVERALWTALRAIEERAATHRRLAERVRERGSGDAAIRFDQRADEGIQQAVVVRELLDTLSTLPEAS
jgi:two-component system chemotaxis response regulator CheB